MKPNALVTHFSLLLALVTVSHADPKVAPILTDLPPRLDIPVIPPEEDPGLTPPIESIPIANTVHQPDNKIGTKKLKGDNIYNPYGRRQSINHLTVKPRKSVTFSLAVQNDGNVVDSFKVKVKAKSIYFSVDYFLVSTVKKKGKLVRVLRRINGKKVEEGKYYLQNMEPGEEREIVVRVTRNRKSDGSKKTLNFKATTTSLGATSKRDTVKATVKSL